MNKKMSENKMNKNMRVTKIDKMNDKIRMASPEKSTGTPPNSKAREA